MRPGLLLLVGAALFLSRPFLTPAEPSRTLEAVTFVWAVGAVFVALGLLAQVPAPAAAPFLMRVAALVLGAPLLAWLAMVSFMDVFLVAAAMLCLVSAVWPARRRGAAAAAVLTLP